MGWFQSISRIACGSAWALALASTSIVIADESKLLSADDAAFFESKIRPLLADNCYKCHATDTKHKGDLILNTRAGVLKGGENGPALVAGEPDKSLLIKAIRYKDEDLQMPPKKKLSDEQIATLEDWVKRGAPDPREDVATAASQPATTGPSAEATAPKTIDFAAARQAWAFQKPQAQPLPDVADKAWPRNEIDNFILAQLEAGHLKPAQEADKRTLMRRAYFDLIGLPPTQAEQNAFLNDVSAEAYEKLVDKLLASPLYGQRWARHWLDVVRYTDSFDSRIIGNDFDCAFAWRYRDWVVDSFNNDLPYDRFVAQQIAGDILPAGDGKSFNKDGIVATGVYMIGEWGGGDADKEKLVSDIVDDQIDLTGRAFMGLTLACARCHDHKFDPIPTKDYYGLAGIFYSSHILSDYGPKGGSPVNVRAPLMSDTELAQRKTEEARVVQLDGEIDATLDQHYTQLASAMLPQADKYLAAAWEYGHYSGGVEKPSIATFAEQHGVHAYELSQWSKFLATPELDVMITPAQLQTSGLYGWRNSTNAEAPIVVINTTEQPISELATLVFPPESVCMHPGPSAGVALSWKSPISGHVRITGKVIDAHNACGDGIAWSISAGGGNSPGEIASGTIANGGEQVFSEGTGGSALASVDVSKDQLIQFAILPKLEYACDTTRVQIEITSIEDGRVWNVEKDALVTGHASNPLPDQFGNATVWNFHDLAKSATSVFASGSPMSRFTVAMGASPDGTALPAAAGEVAKALVAMDAKVREMKQAGQDPATLTTPDAAFYRLLTAPKGAFWAGARADDSTLDEPLRAQLTVKRIEANTLRAAVAQPIPLAQAMQEGGTPKGLWPGIQDVPVHIRGKYDRLGDVVPRHMPQIIAGETQPPITQGSGRLELAKFIASPEHPLTARVMVNRIWQHHFGQGIVRTPNNFGKLGSPPTHPELLDQLAVKFVGDGWSIKAMQREIMLSATYRQSSETSDEAFHADPDNLLLSRQNRHKLEAEALRDSLMSVAGTLDTSAGGVSINDLMTPRRSLYVMTIRSIRADYRSLFDAADASAIVEQRTDSTVAPQALFLMNHPLMLAQAQKLSDRVTQEGGPDDASKIDWLYRTLYARHASTEEIEIGKTLVASQPWEAYCQVLMCANEFMYVD